MKSPILVFPVDADGIPYESRAMLDSKITDKLHRYLLELDTFPGKYPGSIVISESRVEERHPSSNHIMVPGLEVITADGNISVHGYSGGAGKGRGTCPDLEPVKLRQGWAVWLPKTETDSPNELRVRIYGTEGEAKAACVLFGG